MPRELSKNEVPSQPVGLAMPNVPAWQTPGTCARRWMLGLVIAAAVFNFLALAIIEVVERQFAPRSGPGSADVILFLMPAITGVLCGELGAMAYWLVWGEGPFLKRLAAHWAVGLALVSALVCGFGMWKIDVYDGNWGLMASDMIGEACILPVVSLAIQLPLWLFRIYFGWRIEPERDQELAGSSRQLTIHDMLSGTAVVAVTLGMIRAARAEHSELDMAGPVFIAVLVSSILLLPATYLILREKRPMVGVAFYFGYMLIIAISVLSVTDIGRSAPENVFVILWGGLAFSAALAAPFFVWRACGYRLVLGKNQKRA
jgi:hypothetical protein